jgi:hypothetical protein
MLRKETNYLLDPSLAKLREIYFNYRFIYRLTLWFNHSFENSLVFLALI